MNSLDPSIKEQWSMDYQDIAEKTNVFSSIANFRYESLLEVGDTVNRPYMSEIVVNSLGSEGQYTRQDISSTNETLVVTEEKEATFYIKDIDQFQSHYPTRETMARQTAVKLNNRIDGDVLAEVLNADNYIDDGDVGGTAGTPIDLSTTTVGKVFSAVGRKLEEENNEAGERRFGTISPYFKQMLLDKLEGKDTALGDKTTMNGHVGSYYDFELFNTNSAYWVAICGIATQPTADDTISINGVTWTFKAVPSTAGEVDLGADVDATRVLLANAINNSEEYAVGGGSATTYFEVSASDRAKLADMVATDSPSGDTLTVTAEGHGTPAIAETFTDGTDAWTSAIQHLMFGQGRPTDVVVQKSPNVFVKDRSGYIGKDIVNYIVYGKKTFQDGKRRMVDVRLNVLNV